MRGTRGVSLALSLAARHPCHRGKGQGYGLPSRVRRVRTWSRVIANDSPNPRRSGALRDVTGATVRIVMRDLRDEAEKNQWSGVDRVHMQGFPSACIETNVLVHSSTDTMYNPVDRNRLYILNWIQPALLHPFSYILRRYQGTTSRRMRNNIHHAATGHGRLGSGLLPQVLAHSGTASRRHRTVSMPFWTRGLATVAMVGAKRSTGCSLCVKRRVRCDESRPGCANCAKYGV